MRLKLTGILTLENFLGLSGKMKILSPADQA
jgi:hypothetical protein